MDLDTIMASFPRDTEVLQQEHPPSSPSLRPVWWSLSPCLHGSQRLNWMADLKKENLSIKRLLQALPVIHHNSSLPTRAKYKVHQSTRIYVHLRVMRLIKSACFVPTLATKDIPYIYRYTPRSKTTPNSFISSSPKIDPHSCSFWNVNLFGYFAFFQSSPPADLMAQGH